jgi:two-component system NtrC family sensor kinase
MEVQYETLDLNDVVVEVVRFLEKEALYKNIEIQFDLEENLPTMSSDRAQLHQVFLNIITNAIASVEERGFIKIRSWQEDEERLGVSITDNGCGMSEETMRHIFEPFFTTKRGYGTGLGLPITYGIIKKLGGDIKVQSKLGEGTTFTIIFSTKPKTG